MSRLTLFAVPYDSGYRSFRMGRGPERLLESGIVERVEARGHDVEVDTVAVETKGPVVEPGASFAVLRDLAGRVARATAAGRKPLVLAGNCISSVGIVAGLGGALPGAVWFDAHGDLNTPETSPSGFLDGMALSCLTGACWTALTATVPGFRPLPAEHVVLVGARDLDPGERAALDGPGVGFVAPDGVGEPPLETALDGLRSKVERVYLHLDPDVVDAGVARFNAFACPGGPTPDRLERAFEATGERFEIAAATLSAYDPACDPGARDVALRLAEALAGVL